MVGTWLVEIINGSERFKLKKKQNKTKVENNSRHYSFVLLPTPLSSKGPDIVLLECIFSLVRKNLIVIFFFILEI